MEREKLIRRLSKRKCKGIDQPGIPCDDCIMRAREAVGMAEAAGYTLIENGMTLENDSTYKEAIVRASQLETDLSVARGQCAKALERVREAEKGLRLIRKIAEKNCAGCKDCQKGCTGRHVLNVIKKMGLTQS